MKPKFLENANNSPQIKGFLEKNEKNSKMKKKESLALGTIIEGLKINDKNEDFMEIPNIFNDNSQNFNEKFENIREIIQKNKNSKKKNERNAENEDFMIIENIFTNNNISLNDEFNNLGVSLTKNSDSNENPSNDSNKKSEKTEQSEKNNKNSEKNQENYENKENDGFLMNFNYDNNNNNQEERKNKRKYCRKKKKSHIKKDSPFKIEDELTQEMEQYKYAEIRKEDDMSRQTPIIKRLRHRPTIKKHQCF